MTIQQLKDNKWLLFESISGSHAYGTNIPTSDTDIKGVFVLPKKQFYGLEYTEQVNDERNDEVYYEFRRTLQNIEAATARVRPILDDVRVFTDKIARDPRQLGVRGALGKRPTGSGLK